MAKFIAIASGKGGTGRSTISAQIAKSYANLGKRVLAVDLNIGFRSLDLLLELEDKIVFDLGDVCYNKCNWRDAIVQHFENKNLYLLCSPSSMLDYKDLDIYQMIEYVKVASMNYDVVILDLPVGAGLSVISINLLADFIVLVTLPDPISIRDTKKFKEIIYPTNRPVKLIINRVSKTNLLVSKIPNLDVIIDDIGVPLIGVIPENPYINEIIEDEDNIKKTTITDDIFDAITLRLSGRYVPIVIKKI